MLDISKYIISIFWDLAKRNFVVFKVVEAIPNWSFHKLHNRMSLMNSKFLPMCKTDLVERGWDSVDIILVTGDAYVDHPSFAAAILGRWLEKHGYKVGIIAQPDWRKDDDFLKLGRPNLFFGVTAGNLDSLIANRTSDKRPRREDMYSPGGVAGKRPDRAVTVYCNALRKLFKDVPLVIGGIEASLRRISHYDYWSDSIRRPILFDTRAEILVYGMGEKAILQIADKLRNHQPLVDIPNTAYISDYLPDDVGLELFSYEEVMVDKAKFAETHLKYHHFVASDKKSKVVQKCQNKYLVIEPVSLISTEEFDSIFELPFLRKVHPSYKEDVPAYGFVKDSVVTHRGCYGGCHFCALGIHQGKRILNRSESSVVKEVSEVIAEDKDFKGNILDLGGPTANMYASKCCAPEPCERLSCLVPAPCKFLKLEQKKHLELIKKVNSLNGIKKVFINSGIRFDMALMDKDYAKAIIKGHVSGQMSIAPEHICDNVLSLMNKPKHNKFEEFEQLFEETNKQNHKEQYLIPYYISSYPGSRLQDMYELAMYLRRKHLKIKQVQSFIPIPMTIASVMYYTENDPFTGQSIYVAKEEERLWQRALLQPWIKTNLNFLKKALTKIGRIKDLSYLARD